jgi:serine/threonine protein kinase/tetratricopeptide (TPR) repeat protein
MRLSPGAVLGPYEVTSLLGVGGMGEVYRARDTRLGRDVAVKLLADASASDFERRERFIREAKTASRLNHPNIVTIYDIAESGGDLFIVMEYVTGRTLAEVLVKGSLTRVQVINIGTQLASALAKAHASGIIHRDLKPANIIITEEGNSKILDFGIAKVSLLKPEIGSDERTLQARSEFETRPGVIIGTPAYMSPEQAEGRPVDARSDMFSFGVLLYECVTRQQPFRGNTVSAMIAAILRDEPVQIRDLIPGVPPHVESVIHRCLRKDPAQRFPTMSDVYDALSDSSRSSSGLGGGELTPSIAVLAFTNLSGDVSNDYFGNGLAEDIISALGRVKGVRVIARTSTFALSGGQHSIRAIGEKLQVASVLEGSVRKSGQRVRVTAQLIRTSDETQIWSDRYDGDMSDIFSVQDEIARSIVDALRVTLKGAQSGPLVKQGTTNLEAYECFLRGRFHYSRLTPADIGLAIDFQKRALRIDPAYPDPYADLAGYQLALAMIGLAPSLQVYSSVKGLIEKCLSLDHSHALAHTFYGRFLAQYEHQWKDAETHFRRGIELNPAAPLPRNYFATEFLCSLGRTDEALEQVSRAAELDPLAPLHRFGLSLVHTHRKDSHTALRYADEALELNPHFWMALWLKGVALLRLGFPQDAVNVLQQALSIGPSMSWVAGTMSRALVDSGRRQDAEALVGDWQRERAARYAPATTLGFVHANLGNIEQSLDCFEMALKEREPTLSTAIQMENLGVNTEMVLTDPRWFRLLSKMNRGVPVHNT